MRVLRPLGVALGLVLAVGIVWATDASRAAAYTPTITIVDNDAPGANQGIDVGQAYWGYGPQLVHVKKGEQVIFNNAATNKRSHSVTSISLGASAFETTVAAGAKFDSSPTREGLVAPGGSWTLDTSTVDVGNYAYYCRIHPWMVGQITVLPQ